MFTCTCSMCPSQAHKTSSYLFWFSAFSCEFFHRLQVFLRGNLLGLIVDRWPAHLSFSEALSCRIIASTTRKGYSLGQWSFLLGPSTRLPIASCWISHFHYLELLCWNKRIWGENSGEKWHMLHDCRVCDWGTCIRAVMHTQSNYFHSFEPKSDYPGNQKRQTILHMNSFQHTRGLFSCKRHSILG